ncbi:MAG: hypothetical protein IIB12_05185 [Chloroflexi bacterium]|nr:hypothetical protein [Chloroflexota bacterium]MCH8195448.1 hypothetical protein [Chloroflexota bacterium]MCH8283630.1 hypothetical protein [Chloroflexota bacterium]MCI0769631.1 hypothetical protein [Chloroflexota bacterium]
MAFEAKEQWHPQRARMSFTRKILVLDRVLEQAENLPVLQGGRRKSR